MGSSPSTETWDAPSSSAAAAAATAAASSATTATAAAIGSASSSSSLSNVHHPLLNNSSNVSSAFFVVLFLLVVIAMSGFATAFCATASKPPGSVSGRHPTRDVSDRGTQDGGSSSTSAHHRSRSVSVRQSFVSTTCIRAHSFGLDAVQSAGSIIERSKRTYWDDLAPPFGIDHGDDDENNADSTLLDSNDDGIEMKASRIGGSGTKKRRRNKSRRRLSSTHGASSGRSIATGTLERLDDSNGNDESTGCLTILDGSSESSYEYEHDYSDDTSSSSSDGSEEWWDEESQEGLTRSSSGSGGDTRMHGGGTLTDAWSSRSTPLPSAQSAKSKSVPKSVTHFCFLVHGHRGQSRDLGYLHSTLEANAARARRKAAAARRKDRPASRGSNNNSQAARDNVQGHSLGVGTYHRSSSYGSFDGGATSFDDAAADSNATDGSAPSAAAQDESMPPLSSRASAGASTKIRKSSSKIRQNIVVHSAVCNEGKTKDGVVAGGERLVQEMLGVIRDEVVRKQRKEDRRRRRRRREMMKREMEGASEEEKKEEEEMNGGQGERDGQDEQEQSEVIDVTLSMVGNSLGGVYSRYAIARLAELSDQRDDGSGKSGSNSACCTILTIDPKTTVRIHSNVFCTTATPHLGCSRHTYIPLPRSAERTIGHALGETGRDLFRMNDLLKTMSTTDRYLGPLGAFRKRIAYANAYHTDFPVPAATAAFLHEESTYPHHFGEEEGEEDEVLGGGEGADVDDSLDRYIVATLHTRPVGGGADRLSSGNQHIPSNEGGISSSPDGNDDDESSSDQQHDDLVLMSTALDSLGWKKVIVDLRGEIPIGLSVPKVMSGSRNKGSGGSTGITSSLTSSVRTMTARSAVRSNNDSGGREHALLADEDDDDVGRREEEYYEERREEYVAISGGGSGSKTGSGGRRGGSGTLADSALHVEHLRKQSVIESRHAKEAFASPRDGSIRLPVGHNMICAFSRGRISSLMNKGGRPVMDNLAKELVEDILKWDEL